MDPALGRFMVIDPMADFFNNQSPYAMANNNPVGNVDYYGFGIIKLFGNIFGRIGRGVKSIFVGRNCSCLGNGEPDSLGESLRQDDGIFPKKKNKPKRAREAATSNRTRTGPLYGVRSVGSPESTGISLAGTPDISASGLASSIPVITPPTPRSPRVTPPSRNRANDTFEESVGAPIVDINFDIPFKSNTTYLKDEAGAIKILSDLIKTLKEYPQMKVIVEGTLGARNINNPTLQTRVQVNGGVGPAEWLTGGRANAIIKILEGQGVNTNQLIKGNGIIGTNTNVVVKTKSD